MHFLAQETLSKPMMSCVVQNKRSGRRLKIVTEPSKMIAYIHKRYLTKGWRKVGKAQLLNT